MRTFVLCLKLFVILLFISHQSEVFAEELVTFFNYTFEDSDSANWTDVSRGGVKWIVEDAFNQTNSFKPPLPSNGKKYLRLRPSPDGSFSPAIFNSSFYEANGKELKSLSVAFNYWINSEFPEHNNLEVYLYLENGYHRLPGTKFYQNSTRDSKWQYFVGDFDLSSFNNLNKFAVVIMGFCGLSSLDGIALDDIIFSGMHIPPRTSSDAPESTTPTSTATTSTPVAPYSTTTEITSTTSSTTNWNDNETTNEEPFESDETSDATVHASSPMTETTVSEQYDSTNTLGTTSEEPFESDETSDATVHDTSPMTETTVSEQYDSTNTLGVITDDTTLDVDDTETTTTSSNRTVVEGCFDAADACQSPDDYGNYPMDENPCLPYYCVCDSSGVQNATCSLPEHFFDSESQTCKSRPQVDVCQKRG